MEGTISRTFQCNRRRFSTYVAPRSAKSMLCELQLPINESFCGTCCNFQGGWVVT
jgi:hypothetical protein